MMIKPSLMLKMMNKIMNKLKMMMMLKIMNSNLPLQNQVLALSLVLAWRVLRPLKLKMTVLVS